MILSAAPNNRRYPLWRSYLNSSRLLVILVGALDNCHARTLDGWYQELLAPRFEFRTLVQWNHWWHRIKSQTMDAITGKRSYLNSIKSHSHPHTQKCAWRSHFNIIMCEVIHRWFERPMKSNYVSHQHSLFGWLCQKRVWKYFGWINTFRSLWVVICFARSLRVKTTSRKLSVNKNSFPSNFHLARMGCPPARPPLVGECLTPVELYWYYEYSKRY